VKKRHRIVLMGLLLAVLAIAAWFALRPSEPEYQGKKLSAWLDDLVGASSVESEDADAADVVRRQTQSADVIRHIGTNALPYLLRLLEDKPQESPFRDRIEDLLNKQPIEQIRLPERKDRSWHAFQGFAALGPIASPSIPKLERMLKDERLSCEAVECLRVIGSAAIPTLIRAVTNSDRRAQSRALLTLGDFGPAVSQLTPMMLEIVRTTNHALADQALRVLSAINETPTNYLSLFEAQLGDPRTTRGAAFALARIGTPGLPPLLEALTNDQLEIKSSVIAALQPMHTEYGFIWATNPRSWRFSDISHAFDSKCNLANIRLNSRRRSIFVASSLTKQLNCESPGIRLRIVQQLAACGADAAPGLCKALQDSDETVKQEALASIARFGVEVSHGGIIRGPTKEKKVALVFTAHEFAEGGEAILNQLAGHEATASFFLTGDFMSNNANALLLGRMVDDGHYVGPHSGKHVLYCAWENRAKTLLTRNEFLQDISFNFSQFQRRDMKWPSWPSTGYFLPAYEYYNDEIALWSSEMYLTLINFTPGTRSNADYTGEADTNFVSSQAIFDSIVQKEREDPHGLNGFILLLHLGSGPGRKDKFHYRFGELLDYLAGKGYEFVRVDELLEPKLLEPKEPE
jgi:peptidoglycan/xylan/chitin deacetylase (PgdA/CDA1 family)